MTWSTQFVTVYIANFASLEWNNNFTTTTSFLFHSFRLKNFYEIHFRVQTYNIENILPRAMTLPTTSFISCRINQCNVNRFASSRSFNERASTILNENNLTGESSSLLVPKRSCKSKTLIVKFRKSNWHPRARRDDDKNILFRKWKQSRWQETTKKKLITWIVLQVCEKMSCKELGVTEGSNHCGICSILKKNVHPRCAKTVCQMGRNPSKRNYSVARNRRREEVLDVCFWKSTLLQVH